MCDNAYNAYNTIPIHVYNPIRTDPRSSPPCPLVTQPAPSKVVWPARRGVPPPPSPPSTGLHGAKVAITGRRQNVLDAAAKALGSEGITVLPLQVGGGACALAARVAAAAAAVQFFLKMCVLLCPFERVGRSWAPAAVVNYGPVCCSEPPNHALPCCPVLHFVALCWDSGRRACV